MQKIPVRLLSAVAAGTVLLSAFSFVTLNNAVKADSYRTDYTIYGDLNKDDVLDVFDLVLLREKINNKEYDKESDLDSDGILNENDSDIVAFSLYKDIPRTTLKPNGIQYWGYYEIEYLDCPKKSDSSDDSIFFEADMSGME